MRVGGDLAGQYHEAGVGQRLGGHAAARVLLENCVQNRVRDLVGYFVGVAFGDGFGSKEKIVRHMHKLHLSYKARCLGLELSANALAGICESPRKLFNNSAMLVL